MNLETSPSKKAREMLSYDMIKSSLDRVHDYYQPHVETDPIYFPRRFTSKKDQEVVALISALYSFGNVKVIFKTLHNVIGFLGEAPYQSLVNMDDKKLREYPFCKHRWITSSDTQFLFLLLKKILKKHGSLEKSFIAHYSSDKNFEKAISSWMEFLKSELVKIQKKPLSMSQKFMFASPRNKSTTKRMMMFFRWVTRKEFPDLGLWKCIKPSQLFMPLDVHVFRFSSYLGLTDKKQQNWAAVIEITEHFRKINPTDPIRYDFSLARMGITNACIHEAKPVYCNPCLLRSHCRLKNL